LTLEGPHAFMGIQQGKTDEERWQDFWNNFETFTDQNRILSINIAHLQRNEFCNHAFGIQIFKPEPFFPMDNGISQHGFRLLQRMEQKKILLDVKHMSLYARKQLKDYHTSDLPIICTHAGLTGIHSRDRGKFFIDKDELAGGYLRVKYYKPAGYLAGTAFNCSSINLYDDDVINIIFSGGIIGLSMDQRILGLPDDIFLGDDYVDDIFDVEVISPGERNFFTGVNEPTPSESDYLDVYDILKIDRQNYLRYHARHFMNTIFHFFVLAGKNNINPALIAERICIGSDFDGMVNPIDSCRNVTRYDDFKKYLLKNFPEWEQEASYALPVKISGFIKPKDLLENIFYRNALKFLEKHFI
jgi:microsomal dipeptidase-like Zn-dependent dipeptidase